VGGSPDGGRADRRRVTTRARDSAPDGAHAARLSEFLCTSSWTGQILGLDGLINLSKIIFLAAYSTRDVLKLRVLAFVGEAVSLPYFYFQPESCGHRSFGAWPSWSSRGPHRATACERRPAVLSEKEEKLYPRRIPIHRSARVPEAGQPRRMGRLPAGDIILQKGKQAIDAFVIVSGDFDAVFSGETTIALGPGQLVGSASAYSGLASQADVVARGPGPPGTVGPGPAARFCGDQAGAPRDPPADRQRGPCREIARCRDRGFQPSVTARGRRPERAGRCAGPSSPFRRFRPHWGDGAGGPLAQIPSRRRTNGLTAHRLLRPH